MGIESDHLVYEYLSRVGDLAQQRQLASGDRMRLVAGLRDEIDRRRAKYEPETPAAVRRILERIGTPEEVVDALGAAGRGGAGAPPGMPSVPVQRGPGRLRKPAAPPAPPAPSAPPQTAPAPPHLAGLDELGSSDGGVEPDWWRVVPGSQVEGFAGGVEIPELFEAPKQPEPEPEPEVGPGFGSAPGGGLVRFLRERRRAKRAGAGAGAGAAEPAAAGPAAAGAARPRPHAFLLLAAVMLVAGAVTGSWLLLVGGWLLAYASRVLGPAERKWVVFGLPGVVFAGAVVWLWGRLDGRWGAPLTDEGLGGVFQGMWPWLARAAAVASALYLAWRARRR
ncbi:hypothetical protein AB0B01_08365 [Streptomyces sp. NPDC044571]|uniref:hypothetical protein n=1 Tax=Streptomyces sp. NPDC044571 TaxID=3155371 RepID=UPI0033CC8FE9